LLHRLLPPCGGVYCAIIESLSSVAGQMWLAENGGGTVLGVNNNTQPLPARGGEQFELLEAAAPGRIDLSIGRAPVSDPVTSILLRGAAGRDDRDIDRFPDYLDHVRAMMSAPGVPVQLREGDYILRATPAAATEPRLWLLGSSLYSAPLAAATGLPYVFAHSTLELLAKELF
jgi:alkanesulfonate monooxygenase SsuD/methylene tetrahydromethanopterin reductase-like flavin-dependent oxidoreductase (luciferase family)